MVPCLRTTENIDERIVKDRGYVMWLKNMNLVFLSPFHISTQTPVVSSVLSTHFSGIFAQQKRRVEVAGWGHSYSELLKHIIPTYQTRKYWFKDITIKLKLDHLRAGKFGRMWSLWFLGSSISTSSYTMNSFGKTIDCNGTTIMHLLRLDGLYGKFTPKTKP